MTNAIGLVVGIAASFTAWWLIFHWFVSKVEFSSGISSTPQRSNPARRSYRVKLKNTGKRAIVGGEAFARLTIKWEGGNSWTGYALPFNSHGDRKFEFPRLEKGRRRILTFWINKVEMFRTNVRFPKALHKKAKDKQLTLEDLLSLGSRAKLEMFVSGYDEFSGAWKVFSSKEYLLEDIINGRFRGLSIFEAQTEQAEQNENEILEEPTDEA